MSASMQIYTAYLYLLRYSKRPLLIGSFVIWAKKVREKNGREGDTDGKNGLESVA